MRQIGNLPDESSALTFSDYLYVKGIENEVDPAKDGSWAIWVHSDEKLKEAGDLLELYRKNPDLPEYQENARHAERHRLLKLKEDEEFQKKVYDRDRILSWQTQIGLLSGIMIAISIGVYIFSIFNHSDILIQTLSIARHGDNIPPTEPLPDIMKGEIWRIFTPIFLHFGPLHLLFNMMWLKDLGTAIEKQHNSLMLGMLVLSIASSSNLAQYFVSGPTFGGMSGVIYGLFGYIWMQSKYNPVSGFYLDKQIVTMMIAWFFLCLSGLVGPIANTAHGVGLVTGMAIGYASAYVSNHQ
ncbi:MAG: rhomboid family intramembrane serine protease [Kiritimatiellae bacterium]|nr:rhomboid family intramembrane serine protease [Kiritimatiellia bacterium]